MWGEGDPLATYSVDGARCLGVRREGAKRVMLLEPETQPRKGGKATIVSRRVIKNALIDQDSYAELLAERPTKRLGLKITFPHSRAPKHAYLASSPPAGPTVEVPIKHGRQGRAYLAWSVQDPTMFTTYSLRWKW